MATVLMVTGLAVLLLLQAFFSGSEIAIVNCDRNHLRHRLDPMAIGRASRTKVNANMGASPVSSNS